MLSRYWIFVLGGVFFEFLWPSLFFSTTVYLLLVFYLSPPGFRAKKFLYLEFPYLENSERSQNDIETKMRCDV
jgi:hypothetical protein